MGRRAGAGSGRPRKWGGEPGPGAARGADRAGTGRDGWGESRRAVTGQGWVGDDGRLAGAGQGGDGTGMGE